jgi:hypothetical protein
MLGDSLGDHLGGRVALDFVHGDESLPGAREAGGREAISQRLHHSPRLSRQFHRLQS